MDKNMVESSLKSLIEQTYLIEQEYQKLRSSYENLQNIIKDLVDVLPTAIWVLNSDGSLFLQNSMASTKTELFKRINKDEKECEIEQNGAFYLVRIADRNDKKIVFAVDITTQKRNERLVSMGSVAAHLAHEIRNPIGSIMLLASSLERRVSGRESDILDEMQKAIKRVERIINATLLFTKGVQINRDIFAFAELKNECEEALKYYNYTKNIKFELDFGASYYNADKNLLAIVFENLLFNAVDAIEEDENEDGEIRLTYEKTDMEHKFYLYDSGVSIKDTKAVFEPFKTSKLKGNGLGLALCLQIINAHKGSIEVNLKPKCFCVSLPLYR